MQLFRCGFCTMALRVTDTCLLTGVRITRMYMFGCSSRDVCFVCSRVWSCASYLQGIAVTSGVLLAGLGFCNGTWASCPAVQLISHTAPAVCACVSAQLLCVFSFALLGILVHLLAGSQSHLLWCCAHVGTLLASWLPFSPEAGPGQQRSPTVRCTRVSYSPARLWHALVWLVFSHWHASSCVR
jgi:hypothetical protein